MSRLDKRITELEKRAAFVASKSGSKDALAKQIEEIASRLVWADVNPSWAEKQSIITIFATVLHGPAAAIEAVFPRLLDISKREDVAGKLARSLVEIAQ